MLCLSSGNETFSANKTLSQGKATQRSPGSQESVASSCNKTLSQETNLPSQDVDKPASFDPEWKEIEVEVAVKTDEEVKIENDCDFDFVMQGKEASFVAMGDHWEDIPDDVLLKACNGNDTFHV